jgi:uncharacterized transporter YbjL
MKKFINDLLTENDGKSFCPLRVYGALLCVPAMFAMTAAGMWLMIHGKLTLMEFAQAIGVMSGTLTGVFGVGVTVKALTDKPVPKDE